MIANLGDYHQNLAVNIYLGSRENGAARRVWIAISQPLDRRRRARSARKAKRLFLTVGGDKDLL